MLVTAVSGSSKKSAMDGSKAGTKDLVYGMDSPMLSKSRTEKFHKLFKAVPEHEFPIDYFSCAFLGDILLQGNLYVSQNWFCFYSRIKGRGHLLEIPMTKVISITREKTAIIFPNAIGLQTAKEKFAFGSFISRDSTYRFLVSVWKKSQELQALAPGGPAANLSTAGTGHRDSAASSGSAEQVSLQDEADNQETDDNQDKGQQNHNNNLMSTSHSSSKTESTDQSDFSVCLECGSFDPSDTCADTVKQASLISRATLCTNKNHTHTQFRNSVHRRQEPPEKLKFPYSIVHCLEYNKTKDALWKSAIKLQRIPRTNLLLAICTLLVLFLLLSAVGLTYKILDLEAKLAAQGIWTATSQQDYRDKTYGSLYNLQTTTHLSTAKHMQTVLQANVAILEEINSSLKNLKGSSLLSDTQTCKSDDCS